MGFFGKAKQHANTFFSKAAKQTKSFLTKIPAHITSTRKVLTQAAAVSKQAAAAVSHLNTGIQSNDVFGEKLKNNRLRYRK